MTRPSPAFGNAPTEIASRSRRLRALPSPALAHLWPESARFSLLEGLVVNDFRLTIQLPESDVRSANPNLWLAFGYLDAQNFYLIHLQPGDGACHLELHLITAGRRIRLAHATPTTSGTAIRLERNLRTGGIQILLDGSGAPVMFATDLTFTSGQIGIASTPGGWCREDIDLQGMLATRRPLQSAS